mmetsp:Transcript_26016/g.56739  ORF Transcript_26016/g.56739 Transcript_26016/m.56739 type:complete len:278 (+) Transcript_26016:179-1012(+)
MRISSFLHITRSWPHTGPCHMQSMYVTSSFAYLDPTYLPRLGTNRPTSKLTKQPPKQNKCPSKQAVHTAEHMVNLPHAPCVMPPATAPWNQLQLACRCSQQWKQKSNTTGNHQTHMSKPHDLNRPIKASSMSLLGSRRSTHAGCGRASGGSMTTFATSPTANLEGFCTFSLAGRICTSGACIALLVCCTSSSSSSNTSWSRSYPGSTCLAAGMATGLLPTQAPPSPAAKHGFCCCCCCWDAAAVPGVLDMWWKVRNAFWIMLSAAGWNSPVMASTMW